MKKPTLLMIIGTILFVNFIIHLILLGTTPTHIEVVECYDKCGNEIINVNCIDDKVYDEGTYINYLVEENVILFLLVMVPGAFSPFLFIVGHMLRK